MKEEVLLILDNLHGYVEGYVVKSIH